MTIDLFTEAFHDSTNGRCKAAAEVFLAEFAHTGAENASRNKHEVSARQPSSTFPGEGMRKPPRSDVRMAERQPKRRRDLEDTEMTAVLAQLASERT